MNGWGGLWWPQNFGLRLPQPGLSPSLPLSCENTQNAQYVLPMPYDAQSQCRLGSSFYLEESLGCEGR